MGWTAWKDMDDYYDRETEKSQYCGWRLLVKNARGNPATGHYRIACEPPVPEPTAVPKEPIIMRNEEAIRRRMKEAGKEPTVIYNIICKKSLQMRLVFLFSSKLPNFDMTRDNNALEELNGMTLEVCGSGFAAFYSDTLDMGLVLAFSNPNAGSNKIGGTFLAAMPTEEEGWKAWKDMDDYYDRETEKSQYRGWRLLVKNARGNPATGHYRIAYEPPVPEPTAVPKEPIRNEEAIRSWMKEAGKEPTVIYNIICRQSLQMRLVFLASSKLPTFDMRRDNNALEELNGVTLKVCGSGFAAFYSDTLDMGLVLAMPTEAVGWTAWKDMDDYYDRETEKSQYRGWRLLVKNARGNPATGHYRITYEP